MESTMNIYRKHEIDIDINFQLNEKKTFTEVIALYVFGRCDHQHTKQN